MPNLKYQSSNVMSPHCRIALSTCVDTLGFNVVLIWLNRRFWHDIGVISGCGGCGERMLG
jgi:hypothetical protein